MPFELKRYLNWFRNYSQSNARVLIGPLLSPFVYLKVPHKGNGLFGVPNRSFLCGITRGIQCRLS